MNASRSPRFQAAAERRIIVQISSIATRGSVTLFSLGEGPWAAPIVVPMTAPGPSTPPIACPLEMAGQPRTVVDTGSADTDDAADDAHPARSGASRTPASAASAATRPRG